MKTSYKKILKNAKSSRCLFCSMNTCYHCIPDFKQSEYKAEKNLVYRLLMLSGLKKEDIFSLAINSEKHYNVFEIPKQSGGKRTICAPDDDLINVQREVIPLLIQPKCSAAATGFEAGTGVKVNAQAHKSSGHILHMDIKDFFPSINHDMFDLIYRKYYSEEETELLWKIVSYKGGLAVGAPTSPFIANRVMYRLDKKLKRLAFGKRYTRYADDITISSKKRIPDSFTLKTADAVRNAGFTVNDKKTYFMSYRRKVTGVILTNEGRLSVGTQFKKQLKQDLYNYLVHGKGDARKIRGKLTFLSDIEPDYARVIRKKYNDIDKKGFLNFIK